MSWLRKFSCLSIVILAAACSFTPIYKQGETSTTLSHTYVQTMDTREGQLLRIALQDRLRAQELRADATHVLNASLGIEAQPLSIEADGTTRRYRLIGRSTAQLQAIGSDKPLYETTVDRFSSYNISDADYSTYISARDARKQLINALAEAIALRLMTHLAGEEAYGRR